MPSATSSNARIEFRLPSTLKEEIERAALVQNRSLTDFATAALTETARRVLAQHAEQEHLRLSNRDRDRFLEMLDNAATPHRALKAAAKRHRHRVG
jgi:uncharacterized protein (DUF1778 family)